jgi:hypothetical protein
MQFAPAGVRPCGRNHLRLEYMLEPLCQRLIVVVISRA